jgi:hypothetical protein
MLASSSEVDFIVISDNNEVVSNEETLSNIILTEVEWHRQHRTDLAGNLWSIEPSEDEQSDFDHGDIGNWDYNNKVKVAW